MQICLFKDFLSILSYDEKLEILAAAGAQVMEAMKRGDEKQSARETSRNYYFKEMPRYGEMIRSFEQLFGTNAASALSAIIRNPDIQWTDSFQGDTRITLKNFRGDTGLPEKIAYWALDPSNWFLVQSDASSFELESNLSAQFPCLVFDNMGVECASPVPDVKLEGIERILQATGAYEVWNQGLFGKGSKVTVIDTGVESNAALRMSVTGLAAAGLHPDDSDGHGTAITQLIRAIAPSCEITSFKVLNSYNRGDIWRLMEAFTNFLGQENNTLCIALTVSEKLVTMLGPSFQSFQQAITHTMGCLSNGSNFVVCASGNDSLSRLLWPSACRYALAVGAHNDIYELSSFSNYDAAADNFLLAPGGEKRRSDLSVETFGRYGAGLSRNIYGTSFSTAIMAGASALLDQYGWFQTMKIPSRISLMHQYCRKNRQGFPIFNMADIGAIWPL